MERDKRPVTGLPQRHSFLGPWFSVFIGRELFETEKILSINDGNGYIPSKERLILTRNFINKLLKTKNLEKDIKDHNDYLNKLEREKEQVWEEERRARKKFGNPHKTKPGYIYFLQDSSQKIKIGKTINLNNRIFYLGLHLPEKPTLFHHFKTDDMTKSERALHDKYQQYRLNGEWFSLPQTEITKIKEIYP